MDEAERCSHVGYIHQSRLIALGKPVDLKQIPEVTPAGTRRYELTCTTPSDALARAKAHTCVHDATLFGDTLHLLIDQHEPIDSFLATVCPADSAASLRPIGATLEDVFVILSRARQSKDAA
jgi:hypothetical protein